MAVDGGGRLEHAVGMVMTPWSQWTSYRRAVHGEVTFLKAQHLNIYPILREKMPQNFWNLVIPPPFNAQKKVKLGENKTTSKLLDSG